MRRCIRKVSFGLAVIGITANSARGNSIVNVTLEGANFDPTLAINHIDGIAVTKLSVLSPTSATATFTISAAATPGPRAITISTSAGTSNVFAFMVIPPPGVTSIAPPVGLPGTAVVASLTGAGFRSGLTLDAGSGISVSTIVVSSATSAVVTFTIAPDAVLGARGVTLTTSDGTSALAAFNVVVPFPDLVIVSTHSTNFGSEALGSGASTSLDLAISVSSAAAPGVVHAISVATAGDLNPSNDFVADLTAVFATPLPNFVFSPSPPGAGAQATLGLTLPTAFPHDVTGSVTLGFSSNAAIPQDDPAIQFASGGRQTTFVIPANTLQARFGGNSSAGPIGFQTGTVAGALSFSGTLQAGTVQTTFSPSNSVGSSLTIPKQAPSIRNLETSTQNGFAVVINLWSTMREVTQMSLTFSTTTAVSLSCSSDYPDVPSGR